jgi:hypothetical protein
MVSKKKQAPKKRSATSVKKGQATRKRHDLTRQLREDLKATKAALRLASASAREEIKLVNAAAKAEIAVLKDQLAAVMKREQALAKIGEQKAKLMWKAGEQWEKKQVAKIQKAFKKAPKL